jgi:hypothetical protein
MAFVTIKRMLMVNKEKIKHIPMQIRILIGRYEIVFEIEDVSIFVCNNETEEAISLKVDKLLRFVKRNLDKG